MLRGFLFVLNVHTACFHVFPALSPGLTGLCFKKIVTNEAELSERSGAETSG